MAAFNVYENTRTEEWTRESITVNRTFRVVPASAAELVMFKLLGKAILSVPTETGGSVGRIVQVLPHRDPIRPECFCQSAKIKPFTALKGSADNVGFAILNAVNYPDECIVEAVYKTLDTEMPKSDPKGDEKSEKEIVSETFEFGARNLTLPKQYMALGHGTDKILLAKEGLQATKTLPTVELQLTRHYAPKLPSDAIIKLCGRVNKNAFTVGGRTWAPECLRFDGLHSHRRIGPKISPLYDLTYKFAIEGVYDKIDDTGTKPATAPTTGFVGWNRLFRPSTNVWTRVFFANDDTRGPYQLDEDIQQTIRSRTIKGFDLLFHPAAN
jgi:hypothetical protein